MLALKECEGKPKINYVTVFERPGLAEFLKQLSKFADLVLFTAGLEGLLITIPFWAFLFAMTSFLLSVIHLLCSIFYLAFLQVMLNLSWTE